ncbi:unnamed protein product [Rotaria magnacalcarata]|nr:unnamed protein product [Rotaria magnacalcarata]
MSQKIAAVSICNVKIGCRLNETFVAVVTVGRFVGYLAREFVLWNYIQGIQHIFVFDHNNDYEHENLTDILLPLINIGIATVIGWSGKEPTDWIAEVESMAHKFGCPQNESVLGKSSCIWPYKWIGFIDMDEFITMQSNITFTDLLAQFEHRGGLAVFTKQMTWNGYFMQPKNIVKHFNRSAGGAQHLYNNNVKTFVRRDCFIKSMIPHYVIVHSNCTVVTENGDILVPNKVGFGTHVATFRKVALSHYNGGSIFSLILKQARGLWGNRQHQGRTFPYYFTYLNPIPDDNGSDQGIVRVANRVSHLLQGFTTYNYSFTGVMSVAATLLEKNTELLIVYHLLNGKVFDQRYYLERNHDEACRICTGKSESAFGACIQLDKKRLCTDFDEKRGIRWANKTTYLSSAAQIVVACELCNLSIIGH